MSGHRDDGTFSEDKAHHPNRRPSYVEFVPDNWSDMSEEQKMDFANFPGTLKDRRVELEKRGWNW